MWRFLVIVMPFCVVVTEGEEDEVEEGDEEREEAAAGEGGEEGEGDCEGDDADADGTVVKPRNLREETKGKVESEEEKEVEHRCERLALIFTRLEAGYTEYGLCWEW